MSADNIINLREQGLMLRLYRTMQQSQRQYDRAKISPRLWRPQRGEFRGHAAGVNWGLLRGSGHPQSV